MSTTSNHRTYQQKDETKAQKDPRPLKHFRPPLRSDPQSVCEKFLAPAMKIEDMSTSLSFTERCENYLANNQMKFFPKRKFYGSGRTPHSGKQYEDSIEPQRPQSPDQKAVLGKNEKRISQNWRLKENGPEFCQQLE